ncbi:hypothetical protein KAFR_0A04910 [Kazachstania africana CBS 2517]|uniref:3-hydroxyisobutyryl-coenzyme A hydrolase n=1 Tax=Kazachstania africana (strain ATCC 22294 / BCRC 22015 / CBS 2517 / CECT 1963 / NBRC 1671 / NRRL Y-8276) TaxID=1071382 RepID=H2ANH7_KAZAF|nr:hypothetical protein KAFR_0A04910 [Kazachstania africana CBS 2517]CCF55927.1 hypothetical protein KAFR_0A04910 [Kazachstania africana CBS 2517]
MRPCEKIIYEIRPPYFIITLNSAQNYNALSYDDYLYLTSVLEVSNNNEDCCFTVLQSTGSFFSSGADFNSVPIESSNDESHTERKKKWLENFLCKNQYITNAFINHDKILVACLNGPVVGLSAAIVFLCDLVYCNNINNIYFYFPFTKLGLSCEGSVSVTLPMKLSRNQSYQKLLFSEQIMGKEVLNTVINKDFKLSKDATVDTFNAMVLEELSQNTKNVYLPSCLNMKKLLKTQALVNSLNLANSMEVHGALPFWINGEPQRRFKVLREEKMKVSRKSRL